jgi:hypothetical protein
MSRADRVAMTRRTSYSCTCSAATMSDALTAAVVVTAVGRQLVSNSDSGSDNGSCRVTVAIAVVMVVVDRQWQLQWLWQL